MEWKLDKNRAICPQIKEQICVKIACGEYKAQDKLSSVREVALAAGVNPNTVQKAFSELESSGLIYSVRGSGWFVADNVETARATVGAMVKIKTAAYINEMRLIGFSLDEIKKYVEEWEK
ncbi:MAG: GntR family transcriptional regulator [Oscillospiraceae bacterium]|nr:GntR family transcriptional regulator [Oscillospiraceae bacterium]